MVTTVTPDELAALVPATPGLDLVDVRDPEEWITNGHIAGARLVPLAALRADPEQHLVRGKPVVFICASGVRSLQAAKLADRFGYESIYNLDGGTKGWVASGRPMVRSSLAA
jgi:rhodanese-related sulfurtransferase